MSAFIFLMMWLQKIKNNFVVILILLLTVTLRFIPLFDYQYTLDELSGIDRTQFNSFSDLLHKGVKIDAHPALIQTLLYFLTKLFGYTHCWIIKLPFLLFSIGAILFAYFFSLRNFSKQVAIISATVFSFSLIFVFYAPIARMYISGVFFSIALLFYFFEIFFNKSITTKNYFYLGLFSLLSALNQHINGLFAFTLIAAGFFFLNKLNYKKYMITCLLTLFFYLPHLPITFYQLSIGGIGIEQGGWLEKPSLFSVLLFLKAAFGTGSSYLLFLILISLCAISNKKIEFSKKQLFLLFIFILNYLIIYFYSVIKAPVFQFSVMLFSSTAMIVLTCSFLDFKNKYFFYTSFLCITSLLIYKTYFKKDYFNQAVKTVFEYQFEKTIDYKKKYPNNSFYPVFFDCDQVMKNIYFKKYNANFECKISSDAITKSIKLFTRFISTLKTDYLILASSMPLQNEIAKEYYPFLIENTQTQGINFKVFSKKKPKLNFTQPHEDKVLYLSSIKANAGFNYNENNSKLNTKIERFNEFPFEAKIKYNRIISHEGQIVLLKMQIRTSNLKKINIGSCISVSNLLNNELYQYNASETSDFIPSSDSLITVYTNQFIGSKHEKIKDLSVIKCYVWNRNKDFFEISDFEIKVIDHWQKKWSFWD